MNGNSYNISREESETINILRIFLILFVVMSHANPGMIQTESAFFNLLIRFFQTTGQCAVPGFFILSAVLLFRKPFEWKANVKKKIYTLMFPYLILNVFWLVIFYCISYIPVLQEPLAAGGFLVKEWPASQWLDAILGSNSSNTPLVYPLWYLRDLFILNLIAPLVWKAIDNFPVIYGIVLATIVVFRLSTHLFFLSTFSILWFCVGGYLVKYRIHLTDVQKIPFPLLSVLYISEIFLHFHFGGYYFSLATILMTLIFLSSLSCFLQKHLSHSDASRAAAFSYDIYIFHEPVLSGIKHVLQLYLTDTVVYFLSILFVLLYAYVESVFLRKRMPHLYSLITGNRKR